LERVEGLSAYLLAISAGTVALAYFKQWDVYLMVALWCSYGLFLSRFGLERPAAALTFLAATYALFLVASNLFPILRGRLTRSSTMLSLANPVAFAVLSYLALGRLPNLVAVGLYLSLAAIHLAICQLARGRSFVELGRSHLILSLLFGNAAISFVPYFSTETSYFAPVTLLWLIEGAWLARAESRLLRAASVASLGLSTAQLLVVLPWMPDAREVLALSVLSLVGMTASTHRLLLREGWEGPVAALITAVSLGRLMWDASPGSLLVPGAAGMAVLLFLFSLKHGARLGFLRHLGLMLAGLDALAAWVFPAHPVLMLGTAALMMAAGALAHRLEERYPADERGLLSMWDFAAWTVLLRSIWDLGALVGSALTLVMWVASRRRRDLQQGLAAWTALMGVFAVFSALAWPFGHRLELGLTSLSWLAIWALAGPFLVPSNRNALGLVPIVLWLKLSLAVSFGAPGTLLWCLAAMLLDRSGQRFHQDCARAVMFLALLKTVLADGTLRLAARGLELVPFQGLHLLDLAAMAAVVPTFFLVSRGKPPELRNQFLLMGLLAFCFTAASAMHNFFGVLLTYQAMLSAFYCASAFGLILLGIYLELKVLRLFGLTILAACSLKIVLVDQFVLSAYGRVGASLILGGLMMAVSFLYQSHRGRLEEEPESEPNPLLDAA
ncbi:MAG: hypothetical protein AB1758_27865, partial [Candidatus Eremiobacterota bacterium]